MEEEGGININFLFVCNAFDFVRQVYRCVDLSLGTKLICPGRTGQLVPPYGCERLLQFFYKYCLYISKTCKTLIIIKKKTS